MSGYEKRMDNSTNKAKLNDFKNLVDFISCQHATFKKLFYYIIFLKREKRRRVKKKGTLLKCQTLNILNYLETCKRGHKQMDRDAISFTPGETESHFIGCGRHLSKSLASNSCFRKMKQRVDCSQRRLS